MRAGLIAIVLIVSAAALAPIIADHLARWIVIPTVVIELLLGILIGPSLLGWVESDSVIEGVSQLGLAVLIFLAGYEIDPRQIAPGSWMRALAGWIASLLLGLVLVLPRAGFTAATGVIALALTTTALGTLLPILHDRGMLSSPVGRHVLSIGAVGEFAPIVAIALLFSGDRPLHATLALCGFFLMAVVAIVAAARPRSPRVARILSATLSTSAQFAIRLAVVAIIGLVAIAAHLGLDILLGAFAAGLVVRLYVATAEPHEIHTVESKLQAIGYGVLVPFFFITSGVNFDLDALLGHPVVLVEIPLFTLLLLITRGVPTWFLYARDVPDRRQRGALALFSATALPLVVVLANIGLENGWMNGYIAAVIIAGAIISVLVYPLVALRLAPAVEAPREEPVAAR